MTPLKEKKEIHIIESWKDVWIQIDLERQEKENRNKKETKRQTLQKLLLIYMYISDEQTVIRNPKTNN